MTFDRGVSRSGGAWQVLEREGRGEGMGRGQWAGER